jgi:hypothetical protein
MISVVFTYESSYKLEEKHFTMRLIALRNHKLRTRHRTRIYDLYRRKLLQHKLELSCITVHMSTADLITICK